MNKFTRNIFLCFNAIVLASCTPMSTKLKIAEQLIETAPDSALHILQKLNNQNIRGRHNRALYALLMSRALDKNDTLIESDSLITIATDYFDYSDPEHAGYAWFYHARTARNRGDLKEEANNLLKAQEFADISTNDKLLGAVYYDKANLYFNQRQYKQAIPYFKAAVTYYKNTDLRRSLILSNLYIGYCYLYLSKVDSTQFYYMQAEKLASEISDKILLSVIYKNIGSLYFKQKNYHKALKYYYMAPLTDNKSYDSNKYYLIADVYIKTKVLDSAKYYLNRVEDTREIAPDYYRLWQAVAEKEKDNARALSFANKVSYVIDSIYKAKLEISFAGLEKKYKYQVLQVTNQNLTIKNKQRGLLLLFALLSLSVLIVVFLFWRLKVREKDLNYQKDIATKKQELLEKEKENSALLERQLKLQTILLSNIQMYQTNTVKRPNIWRDGSKEALAKQYEVFYNELKVCVDLEFNNFTIRLKDNYPLLTDNDMFISCLLIANFDTGMIATIFNVQADSINKQRYRLRTRLKLLKSDNLIDFLLHF